ncbi:MAG: hypothetical protein ACIAXF_14710 [Phycisphaerales bacterium JB063]
MSDRSKWAGLGLTSILCAGVAGPAIASLPTSGAGHALGDMADKLETKASAATRTSAQWAELVWGGPNARLFQEPVVERLGIDYSFQPRLTFGYQRIDWESAGIGTLTNGVDVPFVMSEDSLDGGVAGLDLRFGCPCMSDLFESDGGFGYLNFSGGWLSGDSDGTKDAGSGQNFAVTYFGDSPGMFTGVDFGDTAAEAELDVEQDWYNVRIGAGLQQAINDEISAEFRFGLFARHSDTDYDGWASSITFPGNMVAYEYDLDELTFGATFGTQINYRIRDTGFTLFAGADLSVYYADADLDADMDVSIPINPTVADRVFSQSADDDEDYWGAELDLRVGVQYHYERFTAQAFIGYQYRSDVAQLNTKDSPSDSGPSIDEDSVDGFYIGGGFSLAW